jgi:hypothetical protein
MSPIQLNKRQFFITLVSIVILMCLAYQSIWIFSRTTMAEVRGTEAYRSRRVKLTLVDASYAVRDKIYEGAFLKDGKIGQTPFFEIRYLIFAPGISRSNTFSSNWGPTVMVFVVLLIIISIAFIRKDILSDKAIVIFQLRRPFLKIGDNEIKDYDEHDIANQQVSETEKVLRERLFAEQSPAAAYEIKASVYKYNPNAIGIIVLYVIFICMIFHTLFFSHMGYGEVLVYGGIALFVPLYVQNTNNKTFKMKILDDTKLVFLTDGVQFEDSFYPLEQIEAAAVYLESFDGFEYRDRTTTGKVNTIAIGDNNKISYRYNSEIIDLTFYLADYKDYFAFKNLMIDWSSKGVNIILQKTFEDDFIVQEMAHFGADGR